MARYRSRRPSTCRYCYGSGHTQRTCPQVKTDAAAGKVWAKDIVQRNKESVQNRACSYCQELKHTARSCPNKINDAAVVEKVNLEWRQFMKKELTQNGCTIGALYRVRPYRYDSQTDTAVCYVEKIEYQNNRATNSWIRKVKLASPTQQLEQEIEQYHRFYGRSKDKKLASVAAGCYVTFRAVSGKGLGYWGEDDIDCTATDEFMHSYSSISNNRYQLIQ